MNRKTILTTGVEPGTENTVYRVPLRDEPVGELVWNNAMNAWTLRLNSRNRQGVTQEETVAIGALLHRRSKPLTPSEPVNMFDEQE